MDRFFLFLESVSVNLANVVPIILKVITNIEDETAPLVFADWLDESDDPDFAVAAEGIRRMFSADPYSDSKKDHNELLNYHNRLVKPIYRFFERLDQTDDPQIDPEHGRISWLSSNGWRTINASDPENITMVADDNERNDPKNN